MYASLTGRFLNFLSSLTLSICVFVSLPYVLTCFDAQVHFSEYWWDMVTGGEVAQLVERRTGTTLTQVPFPGISPRVIFQCRLLRRARSFCVQSHPWKSVCTLKIPSIGSHSFVWTYENTAFAGQRCSCGCRSLTQDTSQEFRARYKSTAGKKLYLKWRVRVPESPEISDRLFATFVFLTFFFLCLPASS